jgi:hypothetical protein
MDATRPRRTRDRARQRWYASQRQRRFARFMGVIPPRPYDEPRHDSLRVALQHAGRVVCGPAWFVAPYPDAPATG